MAVKPGCQYLDRLLTTMREHALTAFRVAHELDRDGVVKVQPQVSAILREIASVRAAIYED